VARSAFAAAVQPVVAAVRATAAANEDADEAAAAAAAAAAAPPTPGFGVSFADDAAGQGQQQHYEGQGLPSEHLLTVMLTVAEFGAAGLAAESAAALREIAMDAGAQLALAEAGWEGGESASVAAAAAADRHASVVWRAALQALADVAAGDHPGWRLNLSLASSSFSCPPQPALDALFGVLVAFPEGLPSSAWTDASAFAVQPLLDLDGRREKIIAAAAAGDRSEDLAVAAVAAADWSATRARHVLVPLCQLCAASRSARSALLQPLVGAVHVV
jgi:hypothetical protein